MNKSELIEALSAKTDVSKAAAGKSIEALVEIITAAVAKGNDVALIGFGTFKAAKRAARTGRNPATGAVLKIAASTVPKFSAGAAFKAAVSGKKAAAKKPAAKKPAAKKK
jgi:DNA-binding protein HU-beta